MRTLTKVMLIFLYPFLLCTWLASLVSGSDRLRLRRQEGPDSLWIERKTELETAAYFSEASMAEGKGPHSAPRMLTRMLLLVGRWHAPSRKAEAGDYRAAADREQGIPDEVYTLW